MTPADIKRLAEQAGFNRDDHFVINHMLTAFAELLAAEVGIEMHKRGYNLGLAEARECCRPFGKVGAVVSAAIKVKELP